MFLLLLFLIVCLVLLRIKLLLTTYLLLTKLCRCFTRGTRKAPAYHDRKIDKLPDAPVVDLPVSNSRA